MDRLAAMETFVRVVEAGSFSAAARQLRLGQPTVSKMVAWLEERVGARLLLRSTHGLTPTEAGQKYYMRAKRALEEVDGAELDARGAAATLSGRLRISASVSFARLHVIPRLTHFLAKHPSLDVEVILDDKDIDLIEAGIDIGLRLGRLPDSALTARKIGSCATRVLSIPSFFHGEGIPRIPTDLLSHEAVIYEQRPGGATWGFRQGGMEVQITLNGRVRVSAAEGVREGVLAGLGFAIASEWLFAPELKSGAVTPILKEWSLPPLDLWAVFPTGRRASAKAHAFASFIEEQLSRLDPAGRIAPAAHAAGA
jgi:DNA-binding transcriptional LysR family regulator